MKKTARVVPLEVDEQINLAREHAQHENYDASLKLFQSARVAIESQISKATNKLELNKLTALHKDTVTEEAMVYRIKQTMDDILRKLDQQELPKPPKPKTPRTITRPNARVVLKKQDIAPRRITTAISDFKHPPPLKVEACPPPAISEKKDPEIDDPLVRQILDTGVLINNPNVQWESIAGLDEIKKLLRFNLVILPMRPDLCHGMLSPWKSVLFYGPPGTGKTFLAKAIATECQRTFFNITSATITSKFHGESEKLIRSLFLLARQHAPSTIFFDEIDAIGSRNESDSEVSRRMCTQFLVEMEGIDSDNADVFILAATNFPWTLTEALSRRFQKRVYVPLPDASARETLLRMNMEEMADDSFNFKEWADELDGYSGADIANLCRDAAQIVLERQMGEMDTGEWLSERDFKVVIKHKDFEVATSRRKSSVDANLLPQYEKWRATKGAE